MIGKPKAANSPCLELAPAAGAALGYYEPGTRKPSANRISPEAS